MRTRKNTDFDRTHLWDLHYYIFFCKPNLMLTDDLELRRLQVFCHKSKLDGLLLKQLKANVKNQDKTGEEIFLWSQGSEITILLYERNQPSNRTLRRRRCLSLRVSAKLFYAKCSSTLPFKASHEVFASPRSIDAFGSKNSGFSAPAYPAAKDLLRI